MTMKTMSTTYLPKFLLFVLQLTMALGGATVTFITAENSCQEPIWVAAVSAPSSPELLVAATGFALLPTESATVSVPSNWSGYLWARTRCGFQQQHFFCLTGDCGSRAIACPRGTPIPMATTVAHFEAEPRLLVAAEDYYSFYVSEATGYNMAVLVAVASDGGGGDRCRGTECVGVSPSKSCPEELRVWDGDEIIGCMSGYGGPAPSELGCFSANYRIHFCASTSCKHYSPKVNSPDFPEGAGPEKEDSKGNKGLTLKIVLGITASVTGIMASLWLSMKFGIISHAGGCCNGNRFNFFFGKVSPTTTNTTNEVPLNDIKICANQIK